MKMLLRYQQGPAYYRMCQQTFTVQNKPAAVAIAKVVPSPIIFRFWNWAEIATVDAAKICGGAENVVKTETQQTFVNGLLGFITLGIYTSAGSACIAHTLYELPIDMGNSICTAH